MQQMGQDPRVMQQYDTGKIFAWIAQLGGLKNITRFRIEIQDPEQLLLQADAGNEIPIGGQSGRTRIPDSTDGVGAPPSPSAVPRRGGARGGGARGGIWKRLDEVDARGDWGWDRLRINRTFGCGWNRRGSRVLVHAVRMAVRDL